MARVYVAGVCLVLMACAASAGAQDFKGIKLGALQDEARRAAVEFASSWICVSEQPAGGEAGTLCFVEGFSYAGASARGATLFFDKEGRLIHVDVKVAPSNFKAVVDALAVKHGKPSKVSRSAVRNGLGLTFEQVEYEWRPSRGTLVLVQRYGETVDETRIVIANERALAARGAAATQKARGDT